VKEEKDKNKKKSTQDSGGCIVGHVVINRGNTRYSEKEFQNRGGGVTRFEAEKRSVLTIGHGSREERGIFMLGGRERAEEIGRKAD